MHDKPFLKACHVFWRLPTSDTTTSHVHITFDGRLRQNHLTDLTANTVARLIRRALGSACLRVNDLWTSPRLTLPHDVVAMTIAFKNFVRGFVFLGAVFSEHALALVVLVVEGVHFLLGVD